MAKAKITWNLKAFEEIRRLPEVGEELMRIADTIADEANRMSTGAGYLAVPGEGRTRSRAAVVAPTPESAYDNAVNNTMIKALSTVAGSGDYEVYTAKSGKTSLITKKQAENYRKGRR